MIQTTARIEKDYYKPKNRKFNKKTDIRWRVVYSNPNGIGLKKESFKDKDKAEKRVDEIKAVNPQFKSQGWSVGDAITFWELRRLTKLKYPKREKSKTKLLRKELGDIRVHELTEEHVIRLKGFLEDGRCIRTVNSYLVCLRTILHYAKRKGAIHSFPDISEHIDSALEVKRERVSNPEEFQRLLDACSVKDKGNRDRMHLRPYLIWLYETGCRVSELAKIEKEDISLERGVVLIWSAKVKKAVQRECGISPRLRKLIEESNYSDGILFPQGSWKKAFATACRIAGIKNLRLHDLRRTAITNMLEKGIPLHLVAKMVGHSANSVLTLDVYTRFRSDFIQEMMARMN